jgi:hypothetical protein
MAENNLTVLQKLTKMLRRGGASIQQPQEPEHTYNLNAQELLRTYNKQEYDTKKLELQQSKYLLDKWVKIDNELYNKSTVYETTRLSAYFDYESMEYTPEISAALDIYAEEATTPSEKGHILSIFSESKRIKNTLANLFNNVLDVNTNLQMWGRNMCKYGDNFLYLKIDPEKGVVGCYQLPNVEIERLEGEAYKNSTANMVQKVEIKDKDDLAARQVKFRWKDKNMDFQPWEIAHFRLLGDDRKLPYGTSMLDKCRRIWKQLLLAEDAMLIYRTSRAPERRVFKVFVGNMDDSDVEQYVQRVANRFKRDQIADQRNGNVDTRYNQMAVDQDFFIPVRDPSQASPIETLPGACIALDTKIPLLDGRTLELKDIIKEWDEGNRNLWVYSCDPKTGKFIPLPITWAGVTRKNTQVLKITLDNGESVTATPDHKFLTRLGEKKEAKDLVVGESLMPLNLRNEVLYRRNNYSKDYKQVWDNEKGKWLWVHKEVAKFYRHKLVQKYIHKKNEENTFSVIHHKDVNRFNNNPTNLCFMGYSDHLKYHADNLHIASQAYSEKYANDENFRNAVNERLKRGQETFHNKRKSDINFHQEISKKQSEGLKNYINSLNEEQLNESFERLKQYATVENIQPMLEWCKNEENLKAKGKKISKAFTNDRKQQHSERTKNNWKNSEFRKKVLKNQTLIFSDEIYRWYVREFEKTGRADLTLNVLNNTPEFLKLFKTINGEISSPLSNLSEFTHNHVVKMLKQRGFRNYREWLVKESESRGYKNVRAWRYYIDKEQGISQRRKFFNHKIIAIEWLEEKQDTGTITVDGNELYSNAHTFGIQCGIYIFNSNLGEIADIEYIQKKMLAALRIPKAFLGFEEVVGEGKGLSLMDIRFARTINRIQKSLIQELNKIAIIHLYLLGLEDELDNFTLGLTNPSTQSDLLKIEQWKEKILLYKDAVGDGQSIAPVSHTFAKKYFLGMSDEEVKLDLQQQKVERGIAEELNNSKDIKTGIFNKINQLYSSGENPAGGDSADAGGASGGGGGGGSMSLPDLGGDMGGGAEEAPPEETGGGEAAPPTGAAAPPATGGEQAPPEEEETQPAAPLSEQRLGKLLDMKNEKEGFIFDLDKGRQKLNEIADELDDLLNE